MNAMSRAQGQEPPNASRKKAVFVLFSAAFAGFSAESGENRAAKPRLDGAK
jgi:hypothetical protein